MYILQFSTQKMITKMEAQTLKVSEYTQVYDTHHIIKKLKNSGASPELAEGIVEAVQEVMHGRVATTNDLKTLETNLNAKLDEVKKQITDSISTAKNWIIGFLLVSIAAPIILKVIGI